MALRLQIIVAVLLFSSFVLAQTSSSAPAPQTPPPVSVASGPYPAMSAAAIARARQACQWFETGNAAPLWAAGSAQMKKQWGSEARLAVATKRIASQIGGQKKVILSSSAPNLLHPNTDYIQLAEYTKSTAKILAMVDLTPQGEVDGMMFRPVPDIPEGHFAGYKDVTKLKLPFAGSWFVYQGGRSLVYSAHFGNDEERYAMDFVVLKDMRPFSGDGSKNEQFYSFGQPLFAPADGTVVRVQDGFADNDPGKPSRDSGLGNAVILYHGNNEYSVLAHLKQNSIKVKRLQKVKQGDVLAECGNSGNSPVPQLEYRLQNSHGYPLPETLPIQFVDYIADGKPVDVGEPVRGQMVSNATQPAVPSGGDATKK